MCLLPQSLQFFYETACAVRRLSRAPFTRKTKLQNKQNNVLKNTLQYPVEIITNIIFRLVGLLF